MATWLSLTNGVQRRLRSAPTATVTTSTYGTLVGKFVNDAKKEVESAWDWTALRSVVTVTTVADTDEYSLTGTNERTRILYGWNTTKGHRLNKIGHSEYYNHLHGTTVTTGDISKYCITGTDSSGLRKVSLYPRPSGVETIKFYTIIPQADLAADATVLTVPAYPVELLAWVFALIERGEDGGFDTQSASMMAQSALNHAIAEDASMVSEEITVIPV